MNKQIGAEIISLKNPEGVYFVNFAVVEWIDVFTRNEYKDILLIVCDIANKKRGWKYMPGASCPIMFI